MKCNEIGAQFSAIFIDESKTSNYKETRKGSSSGKLSPPPTLRLGIGVNQQGSKVERATIDSEGEGLGLVDVGYRI